MASISEMGIDRLPFWRKGARINADFDVTLM